MRPLLLIIGTAIIGLVSYSADARGMGGHMGGGRAHFAGHRLGFHHFAFKRRFAFNRFAFNGFAFNSFAFNRFGFNQRFNQFGGGWGWGYGGLGYGDYGYPNYAVSPNIVVIPQPTPSAPPPPQRAANLPPCHEVTSFGVTVDRGMGCSQSSG
jgi:hypothetical protein